MIIVSCGRLFSLQRCDKGVTVTSRKIREIKEQGQMIPADLEKENGIDHWIKEWGVESKLSVVIIQWKRNWTFLIHESDKFCLITLRLGTDQFQRQLGSAALSIK